jgi:hypothetical protein
MLCICNEKANPEEEQLHRDIPVADSSDHNPGFSSRTRLLCDTFLPLSVTTTSALPRPAEGDCSAPP